MIYSIKHPVQYSLSLNALPLLVVVGVLRYLWLEQIDLL
jgi:hypothetical protein